NDAGDALLGTQQLRVRRIRNETIRAATEQLPTRSVERAADEIPDRRLRSPRPRMVEVDRLAELVDDLGPQRIDADEQPLEQLPVRQRVTACVALDAVVAAHDHDRRFLTRA